MATLTTPALGLRYATTIPSNPSISVTLNAWGLYVMREVNSRTPLPLTKNATKIGLDLTTQWSSALSEGLLKAVNDAKRYSYEFASWDLLARARLAVGVGEFPGIKDADAQKLLSMEQLTVQATDGEGKKRGYVLAFVLPYAQGYVAYHTITMLL